MDVVNATDNNIIHEHYKRVEHVLKLDYWTYRAHVLSYMTALIS